MRKTLAVLILVIAAVGVAGAWYLRGGESVIHRPSPLEVKGQVLARLGAMDCYSYAQDVTVQAGNVTVKSHVDGGFSNGTYYFHGKRSGMEWWGTLRGHHLVERVSRSGETKNLDVNLTDDELSAIMMYEPVRLAIRALGSSNKVDISGKVLTANFTLPEIEGGVQETFSGTIRVRFDGSYRPVEIAVNGKVTSSNRTVKTISFSARIKEECQIPEWEKTLGAG